MIGVIIMRHALAIIAKKSVKTLVDRISRAADRPKAPLAEPAQSITEFLQRQRQFQFSGWHRLLPLPFFIAEPAAVFPNVTVSWMLARHERTAPGRANIVTGIMHGKLNSFLRQPIDIRRLKLLL